MVGYRAQRRSGSHYLIAERGLEDFVNNLPDSGSELTARSGLLNPIHDFSVVSDDRIAHLADTGPLYSSPSVLPFAFVYDFVICANSLLHRYPLTGGIGSF